MTKQWKNEAGYIITLMRSASRSRVDVRDGNGESVLYHEYEYWQQDQAEREAEVLAQMAHAQESGLSVWGLTAA
jgi:hypothetical protein